MAQQIIIHSIDDIPEAQKWLERVLARRVSSPDERKNAELICEELLAELISAGRKEITLSLRGRLEPCIEIAAAGDPVDFDALRHGSGLEGEIRGSILSRFDTNIEYHSEGGKNLIRVYPGRENRYDLKSEIYEYYSQENRADAKPGGILLHLIGKHPLLFWLCMINRSLKHVFALLLPVFASNVIDAIGTCSSFWETPILLNVLLSALSLTLNLLCATLDMRVYQRFTRHVESGFKMALVQKLQVLSMGYYGRTSTGKLLSKLASDVQFIRQLINEQLQNALYLVIDLVFVFIMSLIRLPIMILFFALVVPAAAWLTWREMVPIRESKTDMRKKTESSNASFKEMLSMLRLTRSHGLQRTEYYSVFSRVWNVQTAANRQDMLQVRLNNAGYGTTQGFRILCLCVAVYLCLRGQIAVATVVLFLSLFDALIASVQRVLDQLPQLTQGLDSLDSVHEVLAETDVEKNGTRKLPQPIRGEIEFRNVVFHYPDSTEPVLDHLSFRVPAGQTVAFVGKSGTGKSTLLSLLLGLHAKSSGELLIDGIDIDELDKNDLRRYYSVVPQSSVLFTGTLWDNLVYGLRYITADQVMRALESVGLKELVESHPDGLMQPVFEEGVNFSGGQRQRIAIARALLRNPRIILFDEATSALDQESEKEVQAAIESIMGSCTIILIAHRLYTLRGADLIYRLDGGKAVPVASFKELVR